MQSLELKLPKTIETRAKSLGSSIATLALSFETGTKGLRDLGTLLIELFLTTGSCSKQISFVLSSLCKELTAVIRFPKFSWIKGVENDGAMVTGKEKSHLAKTNLV